MFSVKEIFSTIQGEGSKSGRPAIFVRFTGCNLWSGREKDRGKGKGECSLWCDTDFVTGDKLSADDLYKRLIFLTKEWHPESRMVVFTGGEPCLQLKKEEASKVVAKLLKDGWTVSVETNGTISVDDCNVLQALYIHHKGHITVSPKALLSNMNYERIIDTKNIKESPEQNISSYMPEGLKHLNVFYGNDLKIIIPSPFSKLLTFIKETTRFNHYYLQPMDSQNKQENSKNLIETLELAKEHGYAISIQTHKLVGLP